MPELPVRIQTLLTFVLSPDIFKNFNKIRQPCPYVIQSFYLLNYMCTLHQKYQSTINDAVWFQEQLNTCLLVHFTANRI